jgi:hypothetical protein
MKNNIYVYVILVALLSGIFSGLIGYEHFGNAQKIEQENELLAKDVETKLAEKVAAQIELDKKSLQRRTLQTSVREIAGAIEQQEKVTVEFKALEERLRNSLQLQGVKLKVNQEGVSVMQDQISEDTTAIERSTENMKAVFDLDKQRLTQRENVLGAEGEVDAREKARRLSILDTNIDTVNVSLSRVSNLSPLEISEPWTVGKVLGYNAAINKLVINLGRSAGIRQNFKFSIFSSDDGNRRVYKGFVIIKEVEDLISMGIMEMQSEKGFDPVVGDLVGSLVYRVDKLNFYLGGDFRADDLRMPSKYTKDQLKARLEYVGNRVLSEITSDVDFFVEGSLAHSEIPKATALGISVIPVNLLLSYLGE